MAECSVGVLSAEIMEGSFLVTCKRVKYRSTQPTKQGQHSSAQSWFQKSEDSFYPFGYGGLMSVKIDTREKVGYAEAED